MTTQPPMKDPSVLSVFIGVYRWSISKKNDFLPDARNIASPHQFTSGVILLADIALYLFNQKVKINVTSIKIIRLKD